MCIPTRCPGTPRRFVSHGGWRNVCPVTVPAYAAKYARLPVDTADLLQHPDGSWWLHVVVTVQPPVMAQTEEVVGIDLGLAQPAVTSTNRFLGNKAWKATEGRYFRLKRALQKRGTKSATRHLCRLRHTQTRFRRDCDHVLSKQLAQSVAPGGTLALENLTAIRQRATARRRQPQSVGCIAGRLPNSAPFWRTRQTVVAVDPRHTSQTCSRCGHQARNNRRSRSRFVCRRVALSCMPTSMRPEMLLPSTVPAGVSLRLVRRGQPAYRLRSGVPCVSPPHQR